MWAWALDANMCEANDVCATMELPIGTHTVQLIVNDGRMDSQPDEVNITVVAPIEGKATIMPSTINRKSNQPHVLVHLRLPEQIGPNEIDCNEPFMLYPNGIKAMKLWIVPSNDHGQQPVSIFAFFDKEDLMAAVPEESAEFKVQNAKSHNSPEMYDLWVVGRLKSGQYFYGCDTVRIIDPKRQ
jgi:hypothetical protein